MTNQLQTFNFEANTVRVFLDEDNRPLFVAKDVAITLGYARPNDAIKQHCKGAVIYRTLSTNGGNQQMRVIYEPDVYRLIFGSKLASAVKFQNWVFEEVLPTIRKTGQYRHTITPAQQQAIRTAVAKICKNSRTHYQTVYETLKSHFEIPRYSELLACDFDEAMALIASFGTTSPTAHHATASYPNDSLTYHAQCLAWTALVITSWYQAIEPHFRALSPQLCGEIHDHIKHAKLFAVGIDKQIGLGQMTPMLPYLENKQWAIAY